MRNFDAVDYRSLLGPGLGLIFGGLISCLCLYSIGFVWVGLLEIVLGGLLVGYAVARKPRRCTYGGVDLDSPHDTGI